jgi:hypothetical protein
MIVCSILADWDDSKGKYEQLLETLRQHGSFLFEGNALYFASTEESMDNKAVISIVESNGYGEHICKVFTKSDKPKDDIEPVIYGWLIDHIVENSTIEFDRLNQKALKATSRKIKAFKRKLEIQNDQLEKQIIAERQQAAQSNAGQSPVVDGGVKNGEHAD